MHHEAIDSGGFQSATEVRASLQQQLNSLCAIANVLPLPNGKSALDKFQQQIPAITAVVNTWWTWVLHSLSTKQLSPQTSNWLLTRLLPVVYWQQQFNKTKSPALKQAYHSAYTHAHRLYSHDSLTPTISPEALQHWWAWAEWMVNKFQLPALCASFLKSWHRAQAPLLQSRGAMDIYLAFIMVAGDSLSADFRC